MRTLKTIDKDIQRCKNQIAATYQNQTPQNSEDMTITREGFQLQLKKLENERQQAINKIEVVEARIVFHDAPRQTTT